MTEEFPIGSLVTYTWVNDNKDHHYVVAVKHRDPDSRRWHYGLLPAFRTFRSLS